MPGIFISYRRQSTAAFAGRLFDRLAAHFGKDSVFIDFDHIEPGEDFVEVIERNLRDASALLVLIDQGWLTALDSRGIPRLSNSSDFVRLEIAAALRRGVRVIPVLIDGTPMPSAESLPEELAPLSRRQALEISHNRFHQDASDLLAALDRFFHPVAQPPRTLPASPPPASAVAPLAPEASTFDLDKALIIIVGVVLAVTAIGSVLSSMAK
jgi:hypothetical protein